MLHILTKIYDLISPFFIFTMCYTYFFLISAPCFKVISWAWSFLSAYLTSNYYSNHGSDHLFLWCFLWLTSRPCLFSSGGRLVGHVWRDAEGVWGRWIVTLGVPFWTTSTLNNFHLFVAGVTSFLFVASLCITSTQWTLVESFLMTHALSWLELDCDSLKGFFTGSLFHVS